MEMIIHLKKKTRVCMLLFSLTLIALIEALNVLVGIEIYLAILFFIPVALTAWAIGAKTAYALSVICASTMMLNIYLHNATVHQLASYWNAGLHLGLFLFIVALISQLRERERIIQEELSGAQQKIQALKAFLPICAACKKIRDENDQWIPIEEYIGAHTGTMFSHGICPDCIKKLYPDFAPK